MTSFDFEGLAAEMFSDEANKLLDEQLENAVKWMRQQEARGVRPTLLDLTKFCLAEENKRRHVMTAYCAALWRLIEQDGVHEQH